MATTVFGRDEIILLLGAGASVEAGIPDSNSMVQEIENLISVDERWTRFKDLYRYIRSSIFYADGLRGIFGDTVPFNIERLVIVLEELHKRERHTLYPFVGAWNPKLQEVAGNGFENILAFRSSIIDILRNQWVVLPQEESAEYYSGLLRFQREYQYPLRVFSLNYDLCIEKACSLTYVQRGFHQREWEWRLFNETSDDPLPIMLYKLHGSVDWSFNEDGKVRYFDSPSSIRDEDVAIIFGTSYKLQYIDPFLFCAYELRRWTLDSARVIVCIGYGFNDDHINGILEQALRQNPERQLLAVVGPGDEQKVAAEKERICQYLRLDDGTDKVVTKACGAKEFFGNGLTISALAELFPQEDDLFPPLADNTGDEAGADSLHAFAQFRDQEQ
ncbi:MAG: hypothetical protein F4X14_21655 [Caldilineaceae bacterium SB0661_bin_32]|uniref:Uncharacterized protein n=1 Tax=Caldilineaceae bacterium SB0661_bin_32 TaxID=2605255 RepID=A0A6B1DET6_9CHLR|nr:hypothetical protein [Caldilineaceae bacterium SB0661_bin_32]